MTRGTKGNIVYLFDTLFVCLLPEAIYSNEAVYSNEAIYSNLF